jgi:large subunit ribosomal protein L31
MGVLTSPERRFGNSGPPQALTLYQLVFYRSPSVYFKAVLDSPQCYRGITMKADIHPTYATATVKCACGNEFTTRSTQSEIHTDICGNCHPFYTGKQKLIDTAGRVERFRQKYGKPA